MNPEVPSAPWVEHANCRGKDPNIFFPPLDVGPSGYRRHKVYRWDGSAARAICRACPVMKECREFALQTRQHEGVWGGRVFITRKTANERVVRPWEMVS